MRYELTKGYLVTKFEEAAKDILAATIESVIEADVSKALTDTEIDNYGDYVDNYLKEISVGILEAACTTPTFSVEFLPTIAVGLTDGLYTYLMRTKPDKSTMNEYLVAGLSMIGNVVASIADDTTEGGDM